MNGCAITERYIVVLQEDGEVLCSLDTQKGEALCKTGVTCVVDDYEQILDLSNGGMKHVCFDH